MTEKVTIGHQIVQKESLTRTRDKHNFYPTPVPFIEWMLQFLWLNNILLKPELYQNVLDVGVGTGNWGKVYYKLTGIKIDGVEKYPERYGEDHYNVYRRILKQDIMDVRDPYSLVIGNPPYLKGNKTRKEPGTTELVDHILQNVAPFADVALLLPSNFRHGVERHTKLPRPSVIVDIANRINFQTETGKGGSYPGEYCIMVWDNMHIPPVYYRGYSALWE